MNKNNSYKFDKNFEKCVINYGQEQQFKELSELLLKIENDELAEFITKKISQTDPDMIWNYILMGLFSIDELHDKFFKVVLQTLKIISKKEMQMKQNIEFATGILIYLEKFNTDQLIEICEFCIDSFRNGDVNSEGWKDLLPEIIMYLSKKQSMMVNGLRTTGEEYRSTTVKMLCSMRCPGNNLVIVAGMFKDLQITTDERKIIIERLCESIHRVQPIQLPPLAFQLFSLCLSASQLITPILSLERYFHKHYYRKRYADMDSDATDVDSIDENSDSDFREAEETILFHLANRTEYRITELEVVTAFRGLASTPQFILTPFVISSILILCNINRYPEATSLANSTILPFLRNVIKNNEDEKIMNKTSAWCRDTNDKSNVDFQKVLAILIENNKDGNDVVTPGIVSLAFFLLKAKNYSNINMMGVGFLESFLKKRFIFGTGVIKQLSEFLFSDQDSIQYAECLTTLSITNTLTVSECSDTIHEILNYFLLIPGQIAMKMMPFVFPLIKISSFIRDSLIDVLRKAIYSKELATCQMGVYGFCMLLKQLKNNNSRRVNTGNISTFSQINTISGFSLLSQTNLSGAGNPQRHLDTLTLEIVGILRKCFNQQKEIKDILYEGLHRTIEMNLQIIPHLMQFLDLHFRSYFTINDNEFEIKFDLVVHERPNGFIEEQDNLGELLNLIGTILYVCDSNNLIYDNVVLKNMMETIANRITDITLEQIGIHGSLDHKMSKIGCQFLNCLESIMAYCIWMAKTDNELLKFALKIFKYHQECTDKIKDKVCIKKQLKKTGKTQNDGDTSQKLPINLRAATFKPISILNLPTLERILRIIHDTDSTPFVSMEQTRQIRANRDFSRYILKITTQRFQELQNQPDYRHVRHSRRIFVVVCQISRILYKTCISRLEDLCSSFDNITGHYSMECFKEILSSADMLFKRKFNDFLDVTFSNKTQNLTENCYALIEVYHELIEKCVCENSSINDEENGEKLLPILLETLEILYSHIPGSDENSVKCFQWLLHFCQHNVIESKNIQLIHKLLFTERDKSQTGLFFNSIAMQIQKEAGSIDEEICDLEFELKTINFANLESTILYLCCTLKKQIEDIEYFISKAKCFFTKLKIIGQLDNQEYLQSMRSTERSICSQLIHIAKTVIHLANTQLTIGTCSNTVIRILIQLYVSITNLTKHFIQRNVSIPISFRGIKFDQLVRAAGKCLATKVYNLILYIEDNILPEQTTTTKKVNAQMNKKKVVGASKYIPRLIFCIENFNKFVIILSKKTKIDLSCHLHIGTVRDFRLKSEDLKKALADNDNNDLYDDTNLDEDDEIEDDAEEEEEEISSVSSISVTPNSLPKSFSEISDVNSEKLILKNLKKINQKATKSTKEKEIKHVEIPHKFPKKTANKRKKNSDEISEELEVTESTSSSNKRSSKRINKSKK